MEGRHLLRSLRRAAVIKQHRHASSEMQAVILSCRRLSSGIDTKTHRRKATALYM